MSAATGATSGARALLVGRSGVSVREDALVAERLFAAIWPVAGACGALADTVRGARQAHPDLRWQPAERWHLTLAFLGQSDLQKAAARIERVIGHLPAPEPIRLRGAGTFGPIVWVGVEHGPWLAAAAHDLQRALRVEDRRFRAHVTVARARGRPSEAARAAHLAVPALEGHSGPSWQPTELTLVASRTGPRPAYTVVGTWPWPAPDPGGTGTGAG